VLFHALPHLRGRAYASLFNVMSAAVRGDARALADAIRQDAPWRLPAMARRHRCAAALCAALEPLADDEVASALRAALRKDRWSVRVRQARFAAQLERVVQTLQAAGLEPLLLKGAQRVACATPESALFDSHDIDVLVAPDCVERACEALRAAGYRQDPHPALDYDRHHHAAPLFMQGAIPVEVHRALSLHTLKVPIAWADLKLRARVESSPFGPVTILDPAATAMHLAVHCLQRPALRELVLLARQLQRLDEYETACVRGMLSREQQYAVPLNAAMLLASRLAGTKWACDARAERFAEWMLVREDLPRPLRARVECADAWLAGVALVPSAGKLRAAQRVCTAIAIALYVPFMRR
jgi:hypothetical protein